MRSRVVVFALVVLLVGSLPAGVGAVEPARTADPPTVAGSGVSPGAGESFASVGTSAGSTATTSDSDVLHRTTVLRHRPDDPDAFGVTMTFRIPDSVTELEVELERGATVEGISGFERTGERTFQWTEDADEATIRYAMPADRRGDQRRGTDGSGDGYTFVDTGDWGVVPVPDVSLFYRRSAPVGIEETVRVDGPGAAGDDIAVFGGVTEHERAVDGGTVRLVVPDAATLEESPDAVLAALADARDDLAVGARSGEVFVVAVPNEIDWGSKRGIQYGESDAWVVDDAALDERNPVWLHEYVHVRQDFAGETDTDPAMEWVSEGQADYYAGLLALESGATDFADFRSLLERGEHEPYADGTLVDRSTWDDPETHYAKGALVYGEIDRRLRLATDGDRTLEDVFRTLNAREEPVTEAEFLNALEEEGGPAVRAVAERYTQTAASPEMWSRSEHEAAFEQSVAAFEYGLGSEPIEVADREWPRWTASETDGTDENRDVIAVPVDESVTIPSTVANVGEREGTYDATLQVDGRVVDHRRGTLAPGEDANNALSWTPSQPGEYDVRVGSERLTAVVRSSPSVTVTDLRVSPDGIGPGESVNATATVEAAGDRPAAAVLAFRTVDGVVAERPVALRPDETTTADATLWFDEAGRYEIAVGDRTTMVDVGGGGGPAATVEEMSGFGISAAAVALVMALLGSLVARRRSY
ncbi:CARDB domain-containing protein [Natrinema amylolyticum]|uniref:CARDB domain-containing protein n=1 Tax=Natrinema amylolyticum TaxID=2878679 RepID=UPI001CF97FAD|nr:CARDB domain-containing protein [Natrinema amylolyticum]